MLKEQMEKIYGEMSPKDIPWNIETPPVVLQALVTGNLLQPCKVIELGCGAGNYVIYFARNGFDATGVDLSENAIVLARKSALRADIRCTFIATDVLGDLSAIPGQFDFAYDWELLHHIFPEDRDRFLENVHHLLRPGGLYLSVSFSETSQQFGGVGKIRKTPLGTVLYFSNETEIAQLLEKRFEVEELKTIEIQGKNSVHAAVYALCRTKSR